MTFRSSILIVEDQTVIGMALSSAVEFARGDVVGPAASVESALNLLDTHAVSGAILDVNLADGIVTPLVECLQKRNIPIILQTGAGLPSALKALFSDLVVKMKPIFSQPLVNELFELIAKNRASEAKLSPSTH